MSKTSSKRSIGKKIAQEKAKLKTALPGNKLGHVEEINRLDGKKRPGSTVYLKDGIFFDHPKRGGHVYLVDEYNGKKIAVNRISHSKKAENKMPLPSLKDPKTGETGYVQLDTEYFGKKGRPIKLNQASEPRPGTPEPTEKEKAKVRKYATRDPEKRKKWGSKK